MFIKRKNDKKNTTYFPHDFFLLSRGYEREGNAIHKMIAGQRNEKTGRRIPYHHQVGQKSCTSFFILIKSSTTKQRRFSPDGKKEKKDMRQHLNPSSKHTATIVPTVFIIHCRTRCVPSTTMKRSNAIGTTSSSHPLPLEVDVPTVSPQERTWSPKQKRRECSCLSLQGSHPKEEQCTIIFLPSSILLS